MGSSKKRKHDVVNTPRITYDTPTRIFDRLFKEDSLDELKGTVRKKLGVPSSTTIHLAQLRDGTAVDLEDDDDFEAFHSALYSASVARVKVVLGDSEQPVHAHGSEHGASEAQVDEATSTGKRKKKKKKKHSSPDSNRAATPTDAQDIQDERPTKKRRVSFAAPSSELLSHVTELQNSENETSEGLPEKKEKKKKKDELLEAEASEEPVVEIPDDKKKKKKSKDKEKNDTNASLDAVGRKNLKSKKRGRSGSPERSAEISSSKAGSSLSTTTETPEKPAKKSKKAVEDLETPEASGKGKRSHQTDVNSEPTHAPTANVAAQPSTESPGVQSKAKKAKKKTASKETEQAADSAPPANSSSPEKDAPVVESVAMDKKLTKKKSKTNLETEKSSEVPPQSESAPPKGKKADSGVAKPSAKTHPATSAKKSSTESPDAAASLTATENPKSKALSMEEVANAMAARILEKMASKLGTAEKDTSAVPKATTPAPKASPAIEASSSKESTASAAAAETKTKPPTPSKAPEMIEASSSKELTTTTDTNSSNNAKPSASTTTQVKTAPAKAPRLTAAQKKIPCPVCCESPAHARSRCPTVKSGVKAMSNRIKELRGADAEEHADLIEELEALVDKKSRKTKVSAVNSAQTEVKANAHAELDDSAPKRPEKTAPTTPSIKATPATSKAPAPAARLQLPDPPSSDEEESPRSEPSRSSSTSPPTEPLPPAPKPAVVLSKVPVASSQKRQAQKSKQKNSRGYDKDSSQLLDTSDVSLATGLPGGLLGFGAGDISAFTEGDIEAIIRGPRPSLNSKNLVSSSSSSESEDEDGLEPNVVMDDEEEEEKSEKAHRADKRLSKMAARSDSSDEEVVTVGVRGQVQEDDDEDGDTSSTGDVTLQRNVIEASIVHPSVTSSARASEDVPNESSPSPSTSLRSGEQSFDEIDDRTNLQILDTSVNGVVNDTMSEKIGPVSPEPEIEGGGQVEDTSHELKAEVQAETALIDTDALGAIAAPVDVPEVVAGEEPEPANADSPSSESSATSANTSEGDPIEVESLQASQGDPIHSDADDDNDAPAQAESTPKAKVTARMTRSQRNKAEPTSTATTANTDVASPSSTPNSKAAPAASTLPSQSESGSQPNKLTCKPSRTMKKISELPVPPHPNGSVRIIRPAKVAMVVRTTRSRSAAAVEPEDDRDQALTPATESEAEHESQPKPQTQHDSSIALTRGRRAGSVVPKTPAKTPAAKSIVKTRATSKQARESSQIPETPAVITKPASKTSAKSNSKAATQTPAAKAPSKAAAVTRTSARTKAARLAADLTGEPDNGEAEEEQDTIVNGHAPAPGDREAGNKSLASWDALLDRSSQGPDLSGVSSPTHNMVDELASSSRAATPKAKQAGQQTEAEAEAQDGDEEGTEEAWQLRKDPLFLYDESQQSFPYSQYPGLVPGPSQENSDDDEEEVESTILTAEITKPRASGPYRGLSEISSQSRREYFAPRYSSQLANIVKPAVQDMYGITGDDDDDEGSDGSDSESDSEADRKANNSHIPETRRAGVSSKRK